LEAQVKTHKVKVLWFAYHMCAPPGTSPEALAEALVSCGLIEALERSEISGAVLRYAELPELYRAQDKQAVVRGALKALMVKMIGAGGNV
jgi:hypothetical protein